MPRRINSNAPGSTWSGASSENQQSSTAATTTHESRSSRRDSALAGLQSRQPATVGARASDVASLLSRASEASSQRSLLRRGASDTPSVAPSQQRSAPAYPAGDVASMLSQAGQASSRGSLHSWASLAPSAAPSQQRSSTPAYDVASLLSEAGRGSLSSQVSGVSLPSPVHGTAAPTHAAQTRGRIGTAGTGQIRQRQNTVRPDSASLSLQSAPSWGGIGFNLDPTPSDELYRLGESIRLRMAASSSASQLKSDSRYSPTTIGETSGCSGSIGGRPHNQGLSGSSRLSDPGSADFYFTAPGPLTERDRLPYRQLEWSHADLFSSNEIQEVTGPTARQSRAIKDVDLSEYEVVNSSTSEFGSIGTNSLTTCIAVCARGRNARGETILGLHHYDGCASAEDVLSQLDRRMKHSGAQDTQYYLVGGMMLPQDSSLGRTSHRAEADLLSLRGRYDIRGVRLHQLEGEYDEHGDEHMLSMIMTPDRIYFSKGNLYESEE